MDGLSWISGVWFLIKFGMREWHETAWLWLSVNKSVLLICFSQVDLIVSYVALCVLFRNCGLCL